jgi:hypothetical protein
MDIDKVDDYGDDMKLVYFIRQFSGSENLHKFRL